MRNKLHPLSIFRHSYKLSLANIIGYVLQVPVSLYVASKLGPENYGLVAYVMLWAFYGRLIRPGFFAYASREMPYYIGKEKPELAIRIQNICITYESVYYIIAAAIIIIASSFYKINLIRVGLVLVAVSLLLDLIDSSYMNAQWSYQRFNIITKINLFKTIITPLLTLSLVFLFHVYGLLAVPVAVSLFSIIYFFFFAPKLKFTVTFSSENFLSFLKTGIALQALTFLFWAFRGIDRTIIAVYFPVNQLGIYSFAIAYVHNIYKLISDFGNVLQPVILSELGRLGDSLLIQKEFIQMIVVMTTIGCIITNLVQAGFGAMVFWFVPKFIPSIKIFEILAFNIIFTVFFIVPSTILLSTLVNKQKICNIVYTVALTVIILLSYPMVKIGLGIMGIVYVFVFAQFLISILMFIISKKYLFKNSKESFLFCSGLLAVLFISIVNYYIFSVVNFFKYYNGHILTPFIARISFAVICWGAIVFIMYRAFTKDKIFMKLVKERFLCAE
ncbi:MAG: oligosaccharide flippase family protein [Candidatus Omnitrophota bacterium]|nr:oligosaccharide flippase family protein [Candidatus Omnitrophota bacterium]